MKETTGNPNYDEPPADCQDCTRALDWSGDGRGGCAEYKALNREDEPYNRGGCHSYKGGRKGYENPVQCEHCGTVYPSNKYFHLYEGKMLCCKHFGHEPGSCLEG